MSPRVKWMIAGLLGFAAAGWGITIPITTTSNTGLSSPTVDAFGGITGGALIGARSNDLEWFFYTYTGSLTNVTSATANIAYVVRSDRPPISSANWALNSTLSQWISPQRNANGNGSGCCALPDTPVTSYLVATTFTIPAMTNPPNWPQWWLVMSGTVWADDNIGGLALYSGTSPSGTPIYYQTFSPSIAGPLTSATFSLQTWVNPNQNYTLAFLLNNTANTRAGFRLQWTSKYVTPEPGAWITMLTTGAGLAFFSWRRRRKKAPPVES
jgi:hypothetical protein